MTADEVPIYFVGLQIELVKEVYIIGSAGRS